MDQETETIIKARLEKMIGHLDNSSGETDPVRVFTEIGKLRAEIFSEIREQMDQKSLEEIHEIYQEINYLIDEWLAIAFISLIEKRTANLADQALRDPLTMLYNRTAFDRRLSAEIERESRYRRQFSIALFDIDDFKSVNDRYGHPAGDQTLKMVARILQTSLRQTDFTFRLGGDEFAAICPETEKAAMVKVVRRIEKQLQQSFIETKMSYAIGISFGIASFPIDGKEMDQLVKAADERLYQCKREHHLANAAS